MKENILFNSCLVWAYTISSCSFKTKIMICGYNFLKIISYEEGYNAKWERIQISKEEKPSGGDNYNKQHQKLLLYVKGIAQVTNFILFLKMFEPHGKSVDIY